MGNLRPFQIGLLGIFVFFAILAIVLISGFEPGDPDDTSSYGTEVIIWGTLDRDAFEVVFDVIEANDKTFGVVDYFEMNKATFEIDLVNAIAEGRSPDLIVLSHEQLVRQRSKLLPVPFESVTQREYKDAYVDGANIFVRPEGIYALPFGVDPIVLYWNRDQFASNGLAQAPTTWEGVINSVVPALTIRDVNRNILTSALAFGEYRNIRNASEILALLTMQSGSRMVEENDRGYVVSLNEAIGEVSRAPMEAAVQFYTDFSNAGSPVYTWNRAQPEDRSSFIAGDLAMYFGYGSEANLITERNPNLNFDIASIPQGAGATIRRTFGQFYGFAIPRAAGNPGGGFAAARTLTQPDTAAALASQLLFAPVHRGTLAAGTSNDFESVIWGASLVARGWLDPNPQNTDGILQTMIEDVVSNRVRVSSAVSDAVSRITLSF